MNLRSRLRGLEKLEVAASEWTPEDWHKAHRAKARLQYLSLVVSRWVLVLRRPELPEPYRGVEEDASLAREACERFGRPVPPAIDRKEFAGDDEDTAVLLTLPDWLFELWGLHPPPSLDEIDRWTKLSAEGKAHMAPWWIGDVSANDDGPLPWPPDESRFSDYDKRVWEGRF